jgi:hypothetical protein
VTFTAANKPQVIAGVVIVAVLAVAVAMISHRSSPASTLYSNPAFGFSLQPPSGYAVSETRPQIPPAEVNNTADIIEFTDQGGSVQLTILYAPYASSPLTEESLLPDYPWLASVQTQSFPLTGADTGLALYDDPTHQDQISDVWFAKNNYLYQLTAFGDGFSKLLPMVHSFMLL